MRPLAVCVFCARDAVSSPSPAKVSAPSRRAREQERERAAHADVERQPREADEQRQLAEQEQAAHGAERDQKVALPHRRGQQALDELARAHLDDHVADAPHARGHEVEPEQAGHEEVDVARARLGHARVAHRRRVLAPVGALQDVVDDRARQAALGPRRIELVGANGAGHDDALPGKAGHDDDGHLAGAQGFVRGGLVEELDLDLARGLQRVEHLVRAVAALDRRPHRLGRPVAKGDAERHRQHDGKHEGPEDRRRLAIEAAPARQRQLPQGRGALAAIHGAACRSGPRTRPPGSRGASTAATAARPAARGARAAPAPRRAPRRR